MRFNFRATFTATLLSVAFVKVDASTEKETATETIVTYFEAKPAEIEAGLQTELVKRGF